MVSSSKPVDPHRNEVLYIYISFELWFAFCTILRFSTHDIDPEFRVKNMQRSISKRTGNETLRYISSMSMIVNRSSLRK